jgi:hypothetical protein
MTRCTPSLRPRWSIPAGFTATKVLWLKRHEPENFARVAHILLPHDFVNFRLTGRLAMECGDASGTGLLDPATRAFSPAACSAVDARLLSLLPTLVGPDEAIGTVTEAASALFGIIPAGTPVAPGARVDGAEDGDRGRERECNICGVLVVTSVTAFTLCFAAPRLRPSVPSSPRAPEPVRGPALNVQAAATI